MNQVQMKAEMNIQWLRRVKRGITCLCLLLAVGGCIQDELVSPETSSGDPSLIRFSTSHDLDTRSTSSTTSATIQSMGVFAFHVEQGSTIETLAPNYMYNQEVHKATTDFPTWIYTPLKYWPNNPADEIHFYAYSPHSEDLASDKGSIALSQNTAEGIPTLTFTVPDNADTDLLISAPLVSSRSSVPVNFTFHHALTRVKVKVRLAPGSELPEAPITATVSFTGIHHTATTNLAPIQWTDGIPGDTFAPSATVGDITFTDSNPENNVADVAEFFFLPQPFDEGDAKVTLTLTEGSSDSSTSSDPTSPDDTTEISILLKDIASHSQWNPGNAIAYVFTYTPKEKTIYITNEEDMLAFLSSAKSNPAYTDKKKFVVTNDIDLSNSNLTDHYPVILRGEFDGGGHTITVSNLSSGLFDIIENGATISNLSIDATINTTASTDINIGGICNTNEGTISKCTFIGDITVISSNTYECNVGGICGKNDGGTIFGCTNSSSETSIYLDGGKNCGERYNYDDGSVVGGICGNSLQGLIKQCSNYGNVKTTNPTLFVGGICGFTNATELHTNYNYSDEVTGGSYRGGIAGIAGSIMRIYACNFSTIEPIVGFAIEENQSYTYEELHEYNNDCTDHKHPTEPAH